MSEPNAEEPREPDAEPAAEDEDWINPVSKTGGDAEETGRVDSERLTRPAAAAKPEPHPAKPEPPADEAEPPAPATSPTRGSKTDAEPEASAWKPEPLPEPIIVRSRPADRGPAAARADAGAVDHLAALRSLESQIAKLKLALLVMLFVFSALTVINLMRVPGSGRLFAPSVLAARRFALLDETGAPRGSFGMTRSGSSALTLFSSKGESRATMLVNKDGEPSIGLTNGDGKLRSLLTVDELGPRLAMLDSDASERVVLSADASGQPGLVIKDRSGRPRMRMIVTDHEDRAFSVLSLHDGAGRARLRLALGEDGTPTFNFYDAVDRRYATLVVEDHARGPLIYVMDRDGEVAWDGKR